jgi:hypothetical protein
MSIQSELPVDAIMIRSIPTDGLAFVDASESEPMTVTVSGVAVTIDALERTHPAFRLCEFCHRVYSVATPFTGAPSEMCVHCVFESLHKLVGDEAAWAEAWAVEAENEGYEVPSLANYVLAFTARHEPAACQRQPNCFLCDAALGGAPLTSLAELERWLEDQGFAAPAEEPEFDPKVLDTWLELDRKDQDRALTALARMLVLRDNREVELRAGATVEGSPILRHVLSGVEFAVVPRQGRCRSFLLATTQLSAGQAAALGMPTNNLDPAMPWTGFDLAQLVGLWGWGFRLPLVQEWEVASRTGSGPASLFIAACKGPAPVERSARPVNALGLADLAGQVAELVEVRNASVLTVGGSHLSPTSTLEPLSHDAPKNAAKRRERGLIEEHPIRPLGGFLPSVVPAHVGIRLALDARPRR